MAYEKQTFVNNSTILSAEHLQHIEDGIYQNSVDIENLKSNPDSSQNVTLTTAQINALDGMFKVCAFVQEDVSAQYNAFRVAFGLDSSGDDSDGDTTEKTLTSISASYSGGDVYAGALLTDLTGIVVTAHYSDGTSETVTGYTLSGEILEGSNTITVSYGGKTTAFTVTGIVDSDEGTSGNDAPFDTATWTEGTRITSGGKEYTGHANYSTSDYIDVSGIDSFTMTRSDDVAGNVQYLHTFYDAEKAYLSDTGAQYVNANTGTYPASVTIEIPDGAMYVRLCGTKLSGIVFNELVVFTVNE